MIHVQDMGLERWQLTRSIIHYTRNGEMLYIPKGFVTDFATIPKWLRWLFPKGQDDKLAFIVHDYLYTIGKTKEDRKEADKEMRYTQKSLGANRLRYTFMYLGVRVFGGYYFNKKG